MDIVFNIIISIVIVLMLLLVLQEISEIFIETYRKTLYYSKSDEIVTVCKKDYKEEYVTMKSICGVLVPQIHESQYNVYLMYDDEEYCINSEQLYKEVQKGDDTFVEVHKGYNKRRKLKHVYLTYYED